MINNKVGLVAAERHTTCKEGLRGCDLSISIINFTLMTSFMLLFRGVRNYEHGIQKQTKIIHEDCTIFKLGTILH